LGEFQKRIKETGILNEKYGLISSILDVVEEAKKILLECKDYDSLRKEVVNWFGE